MNKTNATIFNPLKTLKIAGAFIAYLIGSGFATGQEAMQFFAAYGFMGILGGMVSLLLFIYVCKTLYLTGYQFQLRRNEDVFVHYCGKYLGIFITWYTMIFIVAVYAIMLSGTGATLQEYYSFPTYVGAVIMALLSLGTLLLGLKQIVNIISLIGPVIVVVTIFIALVVIINNPSEIRVGAEKIKDLELLRASPHWLLSGLLYVGLCVLGLASFLPAIGAVEKNPRNLHYASFLGPILFVGAMLLLTMALMTKIDLVQGTQIPVMALAKEVFPHFDSFFAIIIFLGIYSTATPLLWTVVARFAEDKTPKYNLLAIILTAIGFLGGMVLPFAKLLNIIYPTIGVVGLLFITVAISKDIRGFLVNNKLFH